MVGRTKLRDDYLLPYHVGIIYEETHKALCSELRVLAAVGIRALIEAVPGRRRLTTVDDGSLSKNS